MLALDWIHTVLHKLMCTLNMNLNMNIKLVKRQEIKQIHGEKWGKIDNIDAW